MDTEKYLLLLIKLMKTYSEEYQTLVTQFSTYTKLTNKCLSQTQKNQFAAEICTLTIPSGKILSNPWMDEIYLLKVVDMLINETRRFNLPKSWVTLYTDVSTKREWQSAVTSFKPRFTEYKTKALFEMHDKMEQWLNSYNEPCFNIEKPVISQKAFEIILTEIKKRTFSRLFINNAEELVKTMLKAKHGLENILAITTIIKDQYQPKNSDNLIMIFQDKYHQLMDTSNNIIRLLICHHTLLNKLRELHIEKQFADKYITIIEDFDAVLKRIDEAINISSYSPTYRDLLPLEELVRSLHSENLITAVDFYDYMRTQRPKNTYLDKNLDFLRRQYDSIVFSKLHKQLLGYVQLISTQLAAEQADLIKSELSDKKIPFYGLYANPWQQEVELIKIIEKQVSHIPFQLRECSHKIFSLITNDDAWDMYARKIANQSEYLLYAQQILALDLKIQKWLDTNRNQETISSRSKLRLFSSPLTTRRNSISSESSSHSSSNSYLKSESSESFTLSPSPNSVASDFEENILSTYDTHVQLPSTYHSPNDRVRAVGLRRHSIAGLITSEVNEPQPSRLSPRSLDSSTKHHLEKSHSVTFVSTGFANQFAELQVNTIIKSLRLNDNNLQIYFEIAKPIVCTLKRLALTITQEKFDLNQLQDILVEIGSCSTQELYDLKENYRSHLDKGIVEFIDAFNQFTEYASQISTARIVHIYLSRNLRDQKHEIQYLLNQQKQYLVDKFYSDLEEIREIDSADKTHILSQELRKTGIEKIIRYLNSYALFNIPRLINKEIAQRYNQEQTERTQKYLGAYYT